MKFRVAAGVIAFASLLLIGRATAHAGTSSDPPAQPRHIVARAVATDQAARGVQVEYRSFSSFAEAISFVTGVDVRIAPGADIQSQTSAIQDAVKSRLLTNTLVGIDYDAASFNSGQGTLTWYVDDPNGCSAGGVFVASSMPAGWDDRVSSAQSFGGCSTWNHYQLTGMTGPYLPCTCSTMGVMDNQTSSERWAP